PKNSVLRFFCWFVACGPTRVSTSKLGIGIRAPHWWQNRWPGATVALHLGHGAPCAGFVPGVPRRGRGSSATAAPHRAHCGTPIGVSALHASHTRPTSIGLKSYPLAKQPVKEGTLLDRGEIRLIFRLGRVPDSRFRVLCELAAPFLGALVLEAGQRLRARGAHLD